MKNYYLLIRMLKNCLFWIRNFIVPRRNRDFVLDEVLHHLSRGRLGGHGSADPHLHHLHRIRSNVLPQARLAQVRGKTTWCLPWHSFIETCFPLENWNTSFVIQIMTQTDHIQVIQNKNKPPWLKILSLWKIPFLNLIYKPYPYSFVISLFCHSYY